MIHFHTDLGQKYESIYNDEHFVNQNTGKIYIVNIRSTIATCTEQNNSSTTVVISHKLHHWYIMV